MKPYLRIVHSTSTEDPWDEELNDIPARNTVQFVISCIMILLLILTILNVRITLVDDYFTPGHAPGDIMIFVRTFQTPHNGDFVTSTARNAYHDIYKTTGQNGNRVQITSVKLTIMAAQNPDGAHINIHQTVPAWTIFDHVLTIPTSRLFK